MKVVVGFVSTVLQSNGHVLKMWICFHFHYKYGKIALSLEIYILVVCCRLSMEFDAATSCRIWRRIIDGWEYRKVGYLISDCNGYWCFLTRGGAPRRNWSTSSDMANKTRNNLVWCSDTSMTSPHVTQSYMADGRQHRKIAHFSLNAQLYAVEFSTNSAVSGRATICGSPRSLISS